MSGVKVGVQNKEIDVLALNPQSHKKVHVEVHVSVRPLSALRAWSSAKYGSDPLPERIKWFYENKFIGRMDKETRQLKDRCIEEKAESIFGTSDYKRYLVVGTLHKNDPEEELRDSLTQLGVKLILMKDIIRELLDTSEVYQDDTRRFLQIISQYISEIKDTNSNPS
jgi:hypothetical protein